MSTPTPDLTEAERRLAKADQWVRRLAEDWEFDEDHHLTTVLAEYDRRSAAERDLGARIDGQAWADLEAERDQLRDELTQMRVYYTTLIMDVVDAAGWTGESFSGLGDHIATLTARSTPGAPTPPAEPSGTAALLALCDALDRLPAPEGAPGRSVPVEEIRRLLRAQSTPGPQVFNCDQSPHPPAQCPRCEPIGGASIPFAAQKLRADTHQDRADHLAIGLLRLRDEVNRLIREDREVENANRCGESVQFDDGKGFTCALPAGHDGDHAS